MNRCFKLSNKIQSPTHAHINESSLRFLLSNDSKFNTEAINSEIKSQKVFLLLDFSLKFPQLEMLFRKHSPPQFHASLPISNFHQTTKQAVFLSFSFHFANSLKLIRKIIFSLPKKNEWNYRHMQRLIIFFMSFQ